VALRHFAIVRHVILAGDGHYKKGETRKKTEDLTTTTHAKTAETIFFV